MYINNYIIEYINNVLSLNNYFVEYINNLLNQNNYFVEFCNIWSTIYSDIFDNDSYNNINIFFCFNLTYVSPKLKKTCFLTTMGSISVLDWVYLNNIQSLKTALSFKTALYFFLKKQVLG